MALFRFSLIFVFITTSTLTTLAQEAGHRHSHHLSNLIAHYTEIKDALTMDDFQSARSHMTAFRNEVVENDEMTHHTEHTRQHAKHHAAMVDAVEQGIKADTISKLRSAFKKVTNSLEQALENQSYEKNTLYLRYCAMADDGKGAHWLSKDKEISNPYMGQKMPGCGTTKKVFGSELHR